MTHKEKAMKIFYEKFNCSQAVLGAYAEDHPQGDSTFLENYCFFE